MWGSLADPLDQGDSVVRCEWGERGIATLAPLSEVLVIVDVLSFSTCVDIAVSRGAMVFPFRWRDERAEAFAASVNAELASPKRSKGSYSLSPLSLTSMPPRTRIVLPSPNGAALSLAAGAIPVLTGCLRNAGAVARAARSLGSRIAVIPAGERWAQDHSLRPCIEDLIGAGAIISHLPGRRSPEAAVAEAAFRGAESRLREMLSDSGSGRELIELGFPEDVDLASGLDVSESCPILRDGAYIGIDVGGGGS